jgi:PilZ domain
MTPTRGHNRNGTRRRVEGAATLKAPGLRTTCIIRDISCRGAKLEVSSWVQLPKEFNLLIVRTNISRHAKLRWRRGNFAGVEFSGADLSEVEVEKPVTAGPQSSRRAQFLQRR